MERLRQRQDLAGGDCDRYTGAAGGVGRLDGARPCQQDNHHGHGREDPRLPRPRPLGV